jgi:hypothetical protein
VNPTIRILSNISLRPTIFYDTAALDCNTIEKQIMKLDADFGSPFDLVFGQQ